MVGPKKVEREERLGVYLTVEEKTMLVQLAAISGLSVSAEVRRLIRTASRVPIVPARHRAKAQRERDRS